MQQTPVHDLHNPDLLRVIPNTCVSLIEIGCSSGALAREFKKINPNCNYLGIDIDPKYVELAKRHCDETAAIDIEEAGDDFFEQNRMRDCWIFGDSLEHLRDPWRVLAKIRRVIPANGSVTACIPNAQHWSVQARLNVGEFQYAESGLLDKTHLRWFTRLTIAEMFNGAGFDIVAGFPRTFDEPNREKYLPVIGELAKVSGCDPNVAIRDAMAFQYVLRAVPAANIAAA